MVSFFRVVNQQVLQRSILLDKIDRSQGNFTGYANKAKQKLYIPYVNPLDTSVKGYIDLAPTDEVLLAAAPKGVIAGLVARGLITSTVISSALLAASAVSASANSGGTTTITGTVFLSVSPDVTYVTLTNTSGVSQRIPQSAFGTIGATSITILDGAVTIGTPTTGWKVRVQANSKQSNTFTM